MKGFLLLAFTAAALSVAHSYPHYPFPVASPDVEGQPCETYFTCKDSTLLHEVQQNCTTCRGLNVCKASKTYQEHYESGFYRSYGSEYWGLDCVSTGVCNITKNSTYTSYDCCHGYTTSSTRNDYHRFHFPLSNWNIAATGCPKALNETVCDCLKTLGLTEFLNLVKETGLNETLCSISSSMFTIFAPTNEAISESSLFTDSDALEVVQSHILPKKIKSKDLFEVFAEDTLAIGHHIHVDSFHSWLTRYAYVNGHRLLISDACEAINGVVHTIDDVINSTNKTIAEVLRDTPSFSILYRLLRVANLTHNLNKTDGSLLTFFAPTNAAFTKASSDLGIDDISRCLASPANRGILHTILMYHMVCEVVYSSIIAKLPHLSTEACSATFETLELDPEFHGLECYLTAMLTDSGISVGMTGSIITRADLVASNGIIHQISLPLIPSPLNLKQLCSTRRGAGIN